MELIESRDIKQILFDMGADLCGIASVDRFGQAPAGFHPHDILPSCKSVIAFAKKFPVGTLHCETNVPYTITRNILTQELDMMSVKFCGIIESKGIIAVPTGTISHTRTDPKTGRSRAMVSAKHSAVAAGLGRIGKNTLLTTPEYGNMVWLSVVLTDAELEPDQLLAGNPCPENCMLCVDNCPVNALGNPEMNQGACWEYAFGNGENNEYGELVIRCHKCRSICPNCLGSERGSKAI